MSAEKSASDVAIELLQEAYDEVEAKNYSAALQRCQAALAIYQTIGDRRAVAYTLTTIADLCRLSLESVLLGSEESVLSESEESVVPESAESVLSESTDPVLSESPESFSLLLEPDIESPPSPAGLTNRLRIRIERGEPDLGPPPPPSRLIIEIDLLMRQERGEPQPPPPPPPFRRSRLVIELTEL